MKPQRQLAVSYLSDAAALRSSFACQHGSLRITHLLQARIGSAPAQQKACSLAKMYPPSELHKGQRIQPPRDSCSISTCSMPFSSLCWKEKMYQSFLSILLPKPPASGVVKLRGDYPYPYLPISGIFNS